MSPPAGGIGLGLVMGWGLGTAPLPASPTGGAAILGALASALATAAAIAGPAAGLGYIIGLAVGFVGRKSFERIATLGEHP